MGCLKKLLVALRQVKGGFMAAQNGSQAGDDRIEKLIIVLGQRITEQNKIFRLIAEDLQGIEASLRNIAVASNPAPNYWGPLGEYSTFDRASIGATIPTEDSDGVAAVGWQGQQFRRCEIHLHPNLSR